MRSFIMKIIAGMHRSGTSLVAGFLNHFGCNLGNPETFHPSDKWNIGGYFEQQEIIAANLKLLHGPYGKLAYFSLPSNKTIEKRGEKISDELSRIVMKYDNSIVKENRFCVTLPAWQKAGLNLDGVIICLRNPLNIVQEIWERNRVPQLIGFQLWYKHLNRLLGNIGDIPRCFILFEHAVQKEKQIKEFSNVLEFLSIPFSANGVESVIQNIMISSKQNKKSKVNKMPLKIENYWEKLKVMHYNQFLV